MASKSSSPKPTDTRNPSAAQASAPASAGSASVTPSSSITEAKKGALSLIDDEGRPKRVRRKAGEPAPAPEVPAEPAGPARETLDDKKKNALSLFDEKEKKKEKRDRKKEEDALSPPVESTLARNVLAPISLLLASKEEAARPKPQQVEAPAPEPAPEAEASAADEAEPSDPRVIHIKPPIIVKDLADRMNLKPFQLIKDLMAMDIFANQNSAVEPDVAGRICEKNGFIFEREKREKGAGVHKVEQVIEPPPPPPIEEVEVHTLQPRPPIVTIMGHVDHGKTSLLDYIRKAKVASGEAGGITQHIGAYTVSHNDHTITFLDTPGHAAFSAMRARGAHLTDIVVLVIAADDGMMPTTHEALSHARASGVKIVVAINKCDLPSADINKVKGQLQQNGLAPEDWGGDTSVVEVSATKGTGVETLLDILLLETELLELKADPKAPVRAIVVESRLEAGKGPTATVIAANGTLKPGMSFICGSQWGKIKSLLNDRGESIKSAGPAIPAEVLGFSDMPSVGTEMIQMKNDKDAKRLSEERSSVARLDKLQAPRRSRMEDLFASMTDEKKTLRLILKCDVQGSTEAIVGALKEIKTEKVRLEFLHVAAGPISDSDVLLASASDATIIGFNTKLEGKAVATAKREDVEIKLFSIIYELIDQVRDAMLGLLDPLTREKVLGHALIKQVFKIQRGYAAGCQVSDGRIARNAHARVLRGKQAIFDGKMSTLRRFSDEVPEVRNGLECGIRLAEFNEYEEGDVIECYELEKFAQAL